jgi:hypothetical protein
VKVQRRYFLLVLALLSWVGNAAAQNLGNYLGNGSFSSISVPEATQALRDSLEVGARKAIAQLGRENGYFGDPKLKIGLPKNFTRAERYLRGLGHGQKVDDLILSMNRAAETAAPQAQGLLFDAVRKMTLDDAKGILAGGDTAVTDYFRQSTEKELAETLMPVIKSVTQESDLARSYNNLNAVLKRFGVKSELETVERYVNTKALEGIYLRIGEEERGIRADPAKYAGSLVGKVFGTLK